MNPTDGRHVLIVEDTAETAELERRTLVRAGFIPLVTHSVDQAKLLLRQSGFAALLLDYRLPDGSAWDVADVANAVMPPVPVVLVTGMGSENVAAEAIQHGVSQYIRKSETFWDDLASAVNRAVSLAQVREELRHDSALFRLIVDNANDIIILLDVDKTILYASGAVTSILGYAPHELLGRPLQFLLQPDEPPGQWHPPAAARRLLRCWTKDRKHVLLEPTFRPVPGAQAANTIGVLRDVTEQVRMEEQLLHQQRMEAIGQLTAGIAHDFNNLLQAMMGSLELLLDEIGDQPEMRACAEGALRMGERGARLTHHLLAFARKQVLKPQALQLPALLTDIAQTLRRILGQQFEIQIEIEVPTPSVYVDPGQLEAAVLNLALNARDAMPEGGKLKIASFEAGPVVLNPRENETSRLYVVMAVSDTGTGMSPETLAKACEPFFTTKGLNGSGLGLSMVQGFARQSGGDVRIHSELGKGTRIEIWLPVPEGDDDVPPTQNAESSYAAGRVLLVDDESEVLVTLSSFLKGSGFLVRTVPTGDEALAVLAAGEAVDVMVTDYAMPGLDGMELITQVRQMHPDLPVLVVSGYAEADRLERQASNVRVMRKPFRRTALVEEVGALIAAATARKADAAG
jgi:PAS domain S-box-containing protein